MATLQEILEKADLNDDVAFEFGGSKFTVGDVRGLRRTLEAETRKAATKREEAEKLAGEAATLLAQLQDATKNKEDLKKKADQSGEDWRNDPFYAPVVKDLSAREAEIKSIRDDLLGVKKQFEQASAVYAYERMKSQFDRNADKLKGKTFEELADEAVKGKHLDRFGMPTLDSIIERITAPDRMEAFAKEKVDAARKQWDSEQRANAAKPGAAARFTTHKDGEKPPIAKLDELTSEKIANDPDIAAAMSGGTVQ